MMIRIATGILLCSLACTTFAQPGDIPNAQPGKCYAKCFVPNRYERVTDQIIVMPASSATTVTPARIETGTVDVAIKEGYTRFVAEAAEFETVTEKILVAPPGKRQTPAAYLMVQDTVLIKPAVKRYTTTDAVFETVTEAVEVEPAYTVLEVMPPQYVDVVERIEIKPATMRWIRKKAGRNCLGADPDDCFVWCLVEEPAQYEDVFKKISRGCDGAGSDGLDCVNTTPVPAKTTPMPVQKIKTPASVSEQMEPAEYQIITKWVLRPGATEPAGTEPGEYITVVRKKLKTPARIREEQVPPVYKPMTRKILKAPATVNTEPIPAEYKSVIKRKLLRQGGFSEWREIVCEEKLSGYTIRQIQEALRALGYYQGAIDNTMNARTKTALIQFQQERELPADGNIDFETLKALGVGY